MKSRYCCCAIPVVNAGIYVILIEQFVVGLTVGILSLSTPTIVGAATPSFAPWIFGIVCLAAAAVQVLGFVAVAKEKNALFKRYSLLHAIVTVAAFAVGGTWAIISAARHSTAVDNCNQTFFANTTDNSLKSQGQTLCNIFSWADVGIMGGLWLVLGITQGYLYSVIASYPALASDSRGAYGELGSATALTDSFAMNNRGDTWSPTEAKKNDFSHSRQDSTVSVKGAMSGPVRQQRDGFSQQPYEQDSYPRPPHDAYTPEPNPTPGYGDMYFGGASASGPRPPGHSQAHPGES